MKGIRIKKGITMPSSLLDNLNLLCEYDKHDRDFLRYFFRGHEFKLMQKKLLDNSIDFETI